MDQYHDQLLTLHALYGLNELELAQYVKKRLSAHAYPREIEFVDELPKTPSGKIQRFLLRNQAKAEAEQAARPAG